MKEGYVYALCRLDVYHDEKERRIIEEGVRAKVPKDYEIVDEWWNRVDGDSLDHDELTCFYYVLAREKQN